VRQQKNAAAAAVFQLSAVQCPADEKTARNTVCFSQPKKNEQFTEHQLFISFFTPPSFLPPMLSGSPFSGVIFPSGRRFCPTSGGSGPPRPDFFRFFSPAERLYFL